MALYIFEAENLGQCSRVIEGLKLLDCDLLVKEKNEITPFESDMLVKVQIQASYEQVLKALAETKNSKTPFDTIRPLQ
ncbi:MAG: hypothetical protein PHY93_19510 [Bacteriovorax sp.]|nr:hypothetical protein [Bacteriovorax sp.]